MCYSLWYNAPTMLPADQRPATSWVHYTTSCNIQSSVLEGGQNNCPKHVELTGIINQPLLLQLVGCLYYLYFTIFFETRCTVSIYSSTERRVFHDLRVGTKNGDLSIVFFSVGLG